MLKNKKGITLIALVVTIIVLLILAGISIMMLTGENGILGRAGEAKVQTGIAEVEEAAKLAYMGRLTNMETGITLGNIATDLRAKGYTVEGPLGEGAEVVNNVTIANPVTVINGGTEIVELVLDKGEASARYFAEV
ncbi:MAG: hypothetical protein IKQ33_00980, partial [Clostridia bacterium]|nr:hypothetical protein [Clostridia bacterium]